jgi:hypothetical protein
MFHLLEFNVEFSESRAVSASAGTFVTELSFFSFFIDAISVSFSNSNNKYEKLIVNYFINKPVITNPKYDFVMIFKARELRRCDM